MQYLVIFEKAADGTVWAKVPDLEEGKPVPEPRLLKAELVAV